MNCTSPSNDTSPRELAPRHFAKEFFCGSAKVPMCVAFDFVVKIWVSVLGSQCGSGVYVCDGLCSLFNNFGPDAKGLGFHSPGYVVLRWFREEPFAS